MPVAVVVDNGTPLLDREAREVLAAAVTEEQTLFSPQEHPGLQIGAVVVVAAAAARRVQQALALAVQAALAL